MSWKFVGESDQSPWRIADLVGKSSAALVDFPMLLPVYQSVTSVISLFIFFFAMCQCVVTLLWWTTVVVCHVTARTGPKRGQFGDLVGGLFILCTILLVIAAIVSWTGPGCSLRVYAGFFFPFQEGFTLLWFLYTQDGHDTHLKKWCSILEWWAQLAVIQKGNFIRGYKLPFSSDVWRPQQREIVLPGKAPISSSRCLGSQCWLWRDVDYFRWLV